MSLIIEAQYFLRHQNNIIVRGDIGTIVMETEIVLTLWPRLLIWLVALPEEVFPKPNKIIFWNKLNNKYPTALPFFSELLYSRAITDLVKLLLCTKSENGVMHSSWAEIFINKVLSVRLTGTALNELTFHFLYIAPIIFLVVCILMLVIELHHGDVSEKDCMIGMHVTYEQWM